MVDVTDVTHLSVTGKQVCAQTNDGGVSGSPHGTTSGELLWLHRECIRFWRSPTTSWTKGLARPDNPAVVPGDGTASATFAPLS